MKRLSATSRIVIGLVCLTLSVLLGARTLGLFPNRRAAVLEGRIALCEAIAITCSEQVVAGEIKRMETALRAIVDRNPQIVSAAIRRESGQVLVQVGDHGSHWKEDFKSRLADTHFHVPVIAGNTPWGKVEICFAPASPPGLFGLLQNRFAWLMVFMGCVCLLVYYMYLRKMLQHMDPSKVVPNRVRQALDNLVGGLLVLDNSERIVLANQAFANNMGLAPDELRGRRASELPWQWNEGEDEGREFPWARTIVDGEPQESAMLRLDSGANGNRTFAVNTSPIVSDEGVHRGVLTSFNDVTRLEQKKLELKRMLEVLSRSREEIRNQNRDLERLATIDPLTGCLNRRSFFERFETHWAAATRYDQPMSCVILDLDFFKAVNDEHGHSTGDLVLKKAAEALQSVVRECDLVCRYGGEEFCVLLPYLDIDQAAQAAERYRQAIASLEFEKLSVTASLGVSSSSLCANGPQDLLEQADKSLYAAKHAGRNQVARWDDLPDDFDAEVPLWRTPEDKTVDGDVSIPFHAVTALISALGYRDSRTAEHSRRVADLCVEVASGLMPLRECYVLEIAALLHDIGKIGVPDSILLKPGPLTKEEWKLMGVHDRIGVEIVRSAFSSDALAKVVETHHAFYGGKGRHDDLPTGEEIPVGARILSIADAYDAMISDRVYRKGRPPHEAFEELRRCAGTQFDPGLVERFIEVVTARGASREAAVTGVTKQTALRVGLQIERLAQAVDEKDIRSLGSLAAHLKQTALQDGIAQIAKIAEQLELAALADDEEPDMAILLELTNELLDLCRMTQSAYLDSVPLESDQDEPLIEAQPLAPASPL